MASTTRTRGVTRLDHDPEALRWALKKSGLTQRDFASQVNISPSYLSEILKGTRNANPRLLQSMADAINCPVVVLEAKRVAS